MLRGQSKKPPDFSLHFHPPRAKLLTWVSRNFTLSPSPTKDNDTSGPMIGENRQLVTNEPVEFEKTTVEVQDCRKIIDHFRGINSIYPNLIKGKPDDVNMLDLQTLGSWPVVPKNLPDHWSGHTGLELGKPAGAILTSHATPNMVFSVTNSNRIARYSS